MSRGVKVLQGSETKHWIDKRKREHKSIACPGNYIRIPAEMMIKFQEIRNRGSKKKLSLIEQQERWEREHQEEAING